MIRAVVTDIEGTTTSISFVYDTLFPYAAERLEEACSRLAPEPDVAKAIEQLRREHDAEMAEDAPAFGDGVPYARFLMARDRKSTGLKMLQGAIWREGYRQGTLRGHVYDDVPGALAAWHRAGLRLFVYSSGSVLAQKLLFSTTPHGDLTRYFEGYHDTTTGPKKEVASYRKIAAAHGLQAAEMLFLSDVLAELDAAQDAGMQTALLVRPGNPEAKTNRHPTCSSFEDLDSRLVLDA